METPSCGASLLERVFPPRDLPSNSHMRRRTRQETSSESKDTTRASRLSSFDSLVSLHPFFHPFLLLADWSRWMQHADLVQSSKPEVLVGIHSQTER